MLKSCFVLGLTFISFTASAKESRMLSSIVDVKNKIEALQRINILSGNIQSVNIIREHFMNKYLEEFKGKKKLSQKDVETFRGELEVVLNSTKTLKAKIKVKKPTSWESPTELLSSFSKEEKQEMDSYFNSFNEEVYPLLQKGMNKKDGKLISDGLTRWLSLGNNYLAFIQKHIDQLKKKVG